MINFEVVRRQAPCRVYVTCLTACRSCRMLSHVRGQGDSRTLCGFACSAMDDWSVLDDKHPEDVAAIDRCALCYRAIDRLKRADRAHLGIAA